MGCREVGIWVGLEVQSGQLGSMELPVSVSDEKPVSLLSLVLPLWELGSST